MKEQELREHAVCSCCKKKIMHTGIPLFWTVHATRHGLVKQAIDRQQGLAMFLGSAALAQVMGPDEEMTTTVDDQKITLCEECAMPILELLERCKEGD